MTRRISSWVGSSLAIKLPEDLSYVGGDQVDGCVHLRVRRAIKNFDGLELCWSGRSESTVRMSTGKMTTTWRDRDMIFEHTEILVPPDPLTDNTPQFWIPTKFRGAQRTLPAGDYIIELPPFQLPLGVPPSLKRDSFRQASGVRVRYRIQAVIKSSDYVLDHRWRDKCEFHVLGSLSSPDDQEAESRPIQGKQKMHLTLHPGEFSLVGDLRPAHLLIGGVNHIHVQVSSPSNAPFQRLTAKIESVLRGSPKECSFQPKWKKTVGTYEVDASEVDSDGGTLYWAIHADIPHDFPPSFTSFSVQLSYTLKVTAHRSGLTRAAHFTIKDLPAKLTSRPAAAP